MSAPLRFLALVVVGWGALRVTTADRVPLAEGLGAPAEASAAVPPVGMTEFPPLAPFDAPPTPPPPAYPQFVQAAVMTPRIVYYSVPVRVASPAYYAAAPRPPAQPLLDFHLPTSSGEQWSLASLATATLPPRQSTPAAPAAAAAPVPSRPPKLDRWQLSSWALLREQGGAAALASGGMLGGSQAGARLTYALTRQFGASLRTTSPVGGRGVEVALGARYQPLRSVPVWVTAERRQAFGRDGGRSAFALFAEGGLYEAGLPWKLVLDGYAQGGVVGINSRDLFADGALALTRPVYKNYAAGFGIWGGAQPGLYRVDAGPRVSMRVKNNIRMHLDYRQRLAGDAEPGSGPAVTLAADF